METGAPLFSLPRMINLIIICRRLLAVGPWFKRSGKIHSAQLKLSAALPEGILVADTSSVVSAVAWWWLSNGC